MSDLQKILVAAVVSAVLSAGVAVFAMQRQIDRVDERQANQYGELRTLMQTSQQVSDRNFDILRQDFNGVRAEIMGILKERR